MANRLPVSIVAHPEQGGYELKKSPPGGLVSALSALKSRYETTWIGWPGLNDPENIATQEAEQRMRREHGVVPLFLNRQQINRYYFGFSNRALWPVLHYLPDHMRYNERDYLAYREVNQLFADRVAEAASEEEGEILVWIQDYQLMLLPAMLRKKFPNLRIGFFLHTPFPSSEMFRTLPYREELLQGLLGSTLIGFHTFGYLRHFSSSVLHILGIDSEFTRIELDTHTLHIGVFPISIDIERVEDAMKAPDMPKYKKMIQNIVAGRRMIISVDRLDYTKGIPDRLRAYQRFLQRNPHRVKDVVLIQISVPSRTEITDSQTLKHETEEIITEIEEAYEHEHPPPIHFLYRAFPFEHLAAFYKEADCALVTPYFDGMNLVAKEYVAVKKDQGVLILSERAGAAYELSEALIVNSWNPDQICTALEQALQMNPQEQKERMSSMYSKIVRNDVHYWSSAFLQELEKYPQEDSNLSTTLFSEKLQAEARHLYRNASRRLLLLDYDGTLTEIVKLPMEAAPDRELLQLLKSLLQLPNTQVGIVTGRNKKNITDWLGFLPFVFSTEHGLWIKWPQEENWCSMLPRKMRMDWYREVSEVFEQYSRTTPGSFTEEKEASLAWHYRMADPTLGKWKANEMIINLQNVLANYPLEVTSGKMVVEVRVQGVNKGNIFDRMQALGKSYDFILAVGDDTTDEHLFSAMPMGGISIKVGKSKSHARYRFSNVGEVRAFLASLLKIA